MFQPRVKELRAIEGWYRTPKSPLYEMYEASGCKLAFSKWLMKNGINPGDKTGKAIISSLSFSFKVTCQYKDINRCSSMYKKEYFNSCLRPGECNEDARAKYMRLIPNLAMMYVPDKAGHIASRAFFVLVDGKIFPFRFYGDHNLQLAFDTLAEKTGLPISDKPVCLSSTTDGQSVEYFIRCGNNPRQEYIYIDTTNSYVSGLRF